MKSKAKLTKLWSILLTLVMVVGLLPTTALAAEPATKTADFTNDSAAALALLNAAKTGEAGSEWDGDTKTLTLNGINFTTTAATAVELPNGATIVLNGENTITGGDADSYDRYGIYAVGSLTIQGSGKLDVTGGTAADVISYGIYAKKALTISGGTVNATGGTATNGDSYGIRAENTVTIQNTADVTATGGTATGTATDIRSCVICAWNGDVTINGGIVNAKGSDSGAYSFGIASAQAAVTISGNNTRVIAEGSNATNCSSRGIYAINDVTISGGTVTANSGTAGEYSTGICSERGSVNISGGAVIAKAGSATTASALNKAPSTLPTSYQWRISNSGEYTNGSFNWSAVSTYVEIRETTPTTYTITFDANGGDSLTPASAVTGADGKLTSLPTPTRSGSYSFNGWYTAASGGTKVDTAYVFSTDTTIYAQWTCTKHPRILPPVAGGGVSDDWKHQVESSPAYRSGKSAGGASEEDLAGQTDSGEHGTEVPDGGLRCPERCEAE